MKKILIINGHPKKNSYNYALAENYINGALLSDSKISRIDIASLNFNPNLAYAYEKPTPLEPDLLDAIEKIKDSDHIVWVFPIWWYGYPAIMKGFIDRVFLPKIAFKYSGRSFPDKLFKGKTARIIVTTDTPVWYLKLIMKNPAINQLKKGTLEFCGIKPVKTSYIGPIKDSSLKQRQKWLRKINELGVKMD